MGDFGKLNELRTTRWSPVSSKEHDNQVVPGQIVQRHGIALIGQDAQVADTIAES
jgi:hypothetical protein